MEKEFVNYDQALKLKDLGFDEPCLMAYIGNDNQLYSKCDDILHFNTIDDVLNPLKAPTFSQAFRWFREKHHLFGNVYHVTTGGFAEGKPPSDWQPEFRWEIYKPVGVRYYQKDKIIVKIGDNLFKDKYNYEEAESACLDNLIEIVESKEK